MLLSDVGSLQEETSSQADQDQRGPDELHQETSHPEIVRLQDELQSALNEVKSIEREAEVAKEAAGTELVLMRRQLTSCQAALVEAEQRVSDAEAQLSDEQAKTMRLEVTLAELQQRLSKMEELEKELEHHRKINKEVEGNKQKSGGGIWGYIAGTPAI